MYSYREGNTNDIEALVELGINSYGRFEKDLNKESWLKMSAFLKDENSYIQLLKISKCFVCEFENELVGMGFLVSSGNPTAIFDKNWSYIRMIGVHTDHSGNGIGKEITKKCIEFAKISEEKIIALHTSELMDAARHIYEKFGFEKIKELDKIFGKKYWLYHMELK